MGETNDEKGVGVRNTNRNTNDETEEEETFASIFKNCNPQRDLKLLGGMRNRFQSSSRREG